MDLLSFAFITMVGFFFVQQQQNSIITGIFRGEVYCHFGVNDWSILISRYEIVRIV